jgi:hypothetical protein
MVVGGLPGASTSRCSDASGPSVLPPLQSSDAAAQGGMSSAGAGGSVSAILGGDAAPALLPTEGAASGVTAWQNSKKITGLWSINQNRNSWVHVDGIGWKKLANNSDSAIVALTLLGAHAREKGTNVNYREESDGMIREMYVW